MHRDQRVIVGSVLSDWNSWMKIENYTDESDRDVFEESLRSLAERARFRVRTAIARIEDGNFGDHKALGDRLFERRIDAEGGVRIYYAKKGEDLVLLLVTGLKRTQDRDISAARARLEDHDRRST